MANRPAPRNWNDIQMVIATISMALTLAFWNLFAGPDRESAFKHAQEQAQIPPSQPIQQLQQSSMPILAQPTPLGNGVLLFGGNAPQTTIIVKGGGGNGGGGGATGGS